MALRNGLLVHGPDALGGRRAGDPTARSGCASGRKTGAAGLAIARARIARGVLRVAEMIVDAAAGPAAAARAAEDGVREPTVIALAVVGDRAHRARRRARRAPADRRGARRGHLAAAGAGVAAQLAARPLPRRRAQGDRRLRAGRGAADAAKEHERCGSHLVAPMLAATVAGNALVSPAASRPPRPRPAGRQPGRGRDRHRDVRMDASATASSRLARALLRRPGSRCSASAATREPTARGARGRRGGAGRGAAARGPRRPTPEPASCQCGGTIVEGA